MSARAGQIMEKMAKREPEICSRILSAFDGMAEDPLAGKPLSGELKGMHSWRVGSYRIIYSIFRDVMRVLIVDVGHRREIYR